MVFVAEILVLIVTFKIVTSLKTADYVSSLIQQHSPVDNNSRHDVVFVGLEKDSNFDVFDEVLAVTMKNNPENSYYIHKSFDSIPWYRVNAASFVIMTTTIQNPVSLV